MVQKIITAFRAKHKFNISNERLKQYAEKWQSKIENEEGVETFIDSLDVEPLEEIAKLDDALRAKEAKKDADKAEGVETPQETQTVDYQKQIDELKALIADKNKADLKVSRTEALKDLPESLKATLKYVPLDSLSDEDFTALQTDLNQQAEQMSLDASKHRPSFASGKNNTISDDIAKEIANKI